MLSTNVFAQTTLSDGDWKYKLNATTPETATLIGLVDSKVGTVEDLKLPATVAGEGTATYAVTKIADGAFAGDDAIKTVTFTTAITEIGEEAFYDAWNITSVTFPEGSELTTIKDGAFAETSALEKIDLSNTKVTNFGAYTPFVKGTTTNTSLEEIVLSANTTNIGVALANLAALTKTNIASTRVLSIGASAFAGDKRLTTLELPEVHLYDETTGLPKEEAVNTVLEDNALAGSFIRTLTINGAVGTGGIGALGATTLTEVNFKGVVGTGTGIAIKASAFVGNIKLAKVTFAEVKAGAIANASFTDCADPNNASAAKALAFSITTADADVFAGQTVFAGSDPGEGKRNVNLTAPNTAVTLTAIPYRVSFTPKADALPQCKVYGTSTYYGKLNNYGTTSVKIKKSVATVYAAYVDGAKVYMNPLQVFGGYQIIDAGQAVIVKTTTPKQGDGYNYIEIESVVTGDPDHTMQMGWYADDPSTTPDESGYKILNDIQALHFLPAADPNYAKAADLKDAGAPKVLYVVADLTKGLTWQTPKDAVRLGENTFYLYADAPAPAAGGRLEVIWLDGSEDATAIKSVKKVAEDGAIYNLAGQKVSASYKGVVIKDGKKYIQK